MQTREVLVAWKDILAGRTPALSIEITKECPLHCPGCYAFDESHLGGERTLRDLSDFRGDALVEKVLCIVDERAPRHVSLVGGDPLVRFRELELLLPQLLARGIFVQVVTSAFRPLPVSWRSHRRLQLVVSVDGLQPEHDRRRAPATYQRILANIRNHQVVIHCTITAQMLNRPEYLKDFVELWSANPNAKKIWMSVFTPQVGAELPEIPSPAQRRFIVAELLRLRPLYSKLDMTASAIEQLLTPPSSPAECIFAQTTTSLSADLKTVISPCQFGGTPDCARCGCMASIGLAALGKHRVAPGITAGALFQGSLAIGRRVGQLKRAFAKVRQVPVHGNGTAESINGRVGQ